MHTEHEPEACLRPRLLAATCPPEEDTSSWPLKGELRLITCTRQGGGLGPSVRSTCCCRRRRRQALRPTRSCMPPSLNGPLCCPAHTRTHKEARAGAASAPLHAPRCCWSPTHAHCKHAAFLQPAGMALFFAAHLNGCCSAHTRVPGMDVIPEVPTRHGNVLKHERDGR